MSVVGQIVVESRRYNGWLDPRYPIGYWQAALTVTGDASAGSIAVDLVFQDALSARLNSQMYSVERFMARTSDGVTRTAKLSAVNMGGPANEGFLHEYALFLTPYTGFAGASLRGETMPRLPWFLGSQRTPGITASLSFVSDNTDLILFTFEAEGYRWSARSVLVDGGPQRPPTGPYRS